MFLTVLEFAVVTLGVKVAIGVALIYYLLPCDGRCADCDGDTIPLQARGGLRWLGHLWRVERRWCLGCGGTMLARRRGSPVAQPAPERDSEERKAA